MNAEICSNSKKFKKFYALQKVLLFDFSGSFLTFQFFRAKIQKSNFSRKVAIFDFSDTFQFDMSHKNSKKSNFSQKVALFDFSGSFLTFRLFRQKFIMCYFSRTIALFAEILTFHFFGQKVKKNKSQKAVLLAKSVTFRLFGQFSHFSIFRTKIRHVLLFAKSCTFRRNCQFQFFGRKVKKIKKLYFSQKVARFDFSGNCLTLRLFGQKFKKSNCSQKVVF